MNAVKTCVVPPELKKVWIDREKLLDWLHMKLQRHRNSSAAQVSIEHFPETLSVSMALVARTNQMHFSDASWKDGILIRTLSLKLMLMSDSVLYTIQCRAQLFLSGSLVTWGIYFLWPPIMAWSSLWRCFKRPEEIFKRTTVQMAVVAPGRFFAANKVSFWCQCSDWLKYLASSVPSPAPAQRRLKSIFQILRDIS